MVGAEDAVPGIATSLPRQVDGEGAEEVVKAPADDDTVVQGHYDIGEDHRVTQTCGL